MDDGIEEDTKTDGQPVELYFYHIWKDRLSWTKHVIPVRALDPSTGFFVEGYISAPPNPTNPEQEILVDSAYLPIQSVNQFTCKVKDIYPTARKLTKIIDKHSVPIDVSKEYLPKEKLTNLNEVFTRYPKMSFTIPELESLLNNTITLAQQKNLVKDGIKRCLITNQDLDAFSAFRKKRVVFSDSPAMDICSNLTELITKYDGCTLCELGTQRACRGKKIVTSRIGYTVGQEPQNKPYIAFIGEAPGVQEEDHSIPFYPNAPAGSILDKVITRSGIDINNCYFTNSVWCRPEPKKAPEGATFVQNGTPIKEHIVACNSRLKNELAVVKPKIVVLLGKTAYHAYYGKEPKNVLSMVGWQPGTNTKVYFMPHPSFIVREISFASVDHIPEIKKKYLNHFTEIKRVFDES